MSNDDVMVHMPKMAMAMIKTGENSFIMSLVLPGETEEETRARALKYHEIHKDDIRVIVEDD